MYAHWMYEIARRAAARDGFWLNEILSEDHTKAEYEALHRAARTLADRGAVRLSRKKIQKSSRTWVELGKEQVSLPAPRYIYARLRIA